MPNGPLDTAVWNYDIGNNDGWGNNELERYTDQQANVSVKDGALAINALRNRTSARINTAGKFDFTYGRIDVVAKLPVGEGVWPAIWLWPTGGKYTSDDPNSGWLANGEIDISEGQGLGDNQISGSAHSVNHYPPVSNGERTGYLTVPNIDSAYHTYSLQWTADKLIYMVDGKPFYEVGNPGTGFKDWPYDQPYHLIINVALGGDMSQGKLSAAALPASLLVQSIKYYKAL
jgi:beta-glucanase (GH16 family)